MPTAHHGDIEIRYETSGDAADAAVLLVMGLGAQLTAWSDAWCQAFVDAGRFVIRFDNRDCGLSTKLDGVQVDLPRIMAAWAGDGEMPAVPYLLSDMAADAVAVLDAAGVERAHVVGASLGGMIAQTIATQHPARTASLTSIMSTTGEPAFYGSDPQVRTRLLAPAPSDRDGAIESSVEMARLLGGRRWFDEAAARERARAAYDRAWYPEGMARQTAAIRASGSRDAALRELRTPTLVVHGAEDRLILPSAGVHTAEVIPSADLLLLQDMGHDLPAPLVPFIVGAIVQHADLPA